MRARSANGLYRLIFVFFIAILEKIFALGCWRDREEGSSRQIRFVLLSCVVIKISFQFQASLQIGWVALWKSLKICPAAHHLSTRSTSSTHSGQFVKNHGSVRKRAADFRRISTLCQDRL